MPLDTVKEPITLYRGTGRLERKRRMYGFSWSSRLSVARDFAEHWAKTGEGGVVLTTVAPPAAILLIREDEDYYDEGEVVVDPFALGHVEVLEKLWVA